MPPRSSTRTGTVTDHISIRTRAITASALLDERRVVLTGLQHLGAHVIEADHEDVSERLAQAFVDIKRRNLL
jgi:hypothetical protein